MPPAPPPVDPADGEEPVEVPVDWLEPAEVPLAPPPVDPADGEEPVEVPVD